MNEDNKLTQEQIKTANQIEEARWQGDFDPETLKIPYKHEESNNSDKKDDKTVEINNENEQEEQIVETYDDPKSAVTVLDPGDFTPADYSFEVTLKDGKTHKVSTPDEADKLAEDPENFETPKQLLDFIRRSQKMENQLDKDKEKWDSEKKIFEEQSKIEQDRLDTVNNFTNEMLYLVDKGMIPDIEDKEVKQRWLTDGTASKDKEFIKNPGVKEQIELLDYLVKENARREKIGVRPLTSLIDAFNGWQLDTDLKKQAAEIKAVGEARKAAGARVSGVSSSNQAPYVPKGIAVGNPNVFKRSQNIWAD